MSQPEKQVVPYTLRELLEAGVHFGHQKQRWNPKMKPFIYGVKNGVHIVDLTQTYVMLNKALVAVKNCVRDGGRVLFVGTKKQASLPISQSAEQCAQYFVNHRWLGGMMTNWKTVSHSLKRLSELDERIEKKFGYTKKELLSFSRQRDRINRDLGGIRTMGGLPSMLFVIDINKEHLAIKEAKKIGIPIVAIVDTNADPYSVDYPIPGNDDAIRSIDLYCDLISRAALEGLREQEENNSHKDAGEAENPNVDISDIDRPLEDNKVEENSEKEATN